MTRFKILYNKYKLSRDINPYKKLRALIWNRKDKFQLKNPSCNFYEMCIKVLRINLHHFWPTHFSTKRFTSMISWKFLDVVGYASIQHRADKSSKKQKFDFLQTIYLNNFLKRTYFKKYFLMWLTFFLLLV